MIGIRKVTELQLTGFSKGFVVKKNADGPLYRLPYELVVEIMNNSDVRTLLSSKSQRPKS